MALYAANLCLLPPFLALPNLFHHEGSLVAQLRSDDDLNDDDSSSSSCLARCDNTGAMVVNPLTVPMLDREGIMKEGMLLGDTDDYPAHARRSLDFELSERRKSKGSGRRVRWSDELGFTLTAVREFESSEPRGSHENHWEAEDEVCNCAVQ